MYVVFVIHKYKLHPISIKKLDVLKNLFKDLECKEVDSRISYGYFFR